MANKIEKEKEVSNIFETLAENSLNEVKELQYGDLTVKVSAAVPYLDRRVAIESAVSIIFDKNEKDLSNYDVAAISFARRYAVLICFTDLDLRKINEGIWFIINYSPLFQDVVNIVGTNNITDLLNELDELIQFKKEELLQPFSFDKIFDKLMVAFKPLLPKLKKRFKNIDFEGLVDKFKDINADELMLKLQGMMGDVLPQKN